MSASHITSSMPWFTRANSDYIAFKQLIKQKPNTDLALCVYLIQQSVEKTVKGLAISTGKITPSEIRKFCHKSEKVIERLFHELTNKGYLAKENIKIFELNSWTFSENDIGNALYIIQQMNLNPPFNIDDRYKFEKGDSFEVNLEVNLLTKLTYNLMCYETAKHSIKNRLLADWLLLRLLILAIITVPHEATSRYPRVNRKTILDCHSYNKKLGIVKHLEQIGDIMQEILDNIDNVNSTICHLFQRKP